jgi:hypothetical protein
MMKAEGANENLFSDLSEAHPMFCKYVSDFGYLGKYRGVKVA